MPITGAVLNASTMAAIGSIGAIGFSGNVWESPRMIPASAQNAQSMVFISAHFRLALVAKSVGFAPKRGAAC
jgi:hypothetical protein